MTLFQINLLIYIVTAFMVVVGIVGLRKWNRLSKPLRLLEVYILLSIASAIIENVLADYNIRNLWAHHLFSVVELFLYSWIYFLWRSSKRYGTLLWAAYGVYIAVWIVGKFSFEPFYYSDVYSGAISQIIQIGFGGWLLFIISQEQGFEWNRDPRFTVVTGITIYASATFLLYMMFNLMLTLPRQTMRNIWLLNLLFMTLQYILFLRAFLCKLISASVSD